MQRRAVLVVGFIAAVGAAVAVAVATWPFALADPVASSSGRPSALARSTPPDPSASSVPGAPGAPAAPAASDLATGSPSDGAARPVVRLGGFVRRMPGGPAAYAGVGGVAIIARGPSGTAVHVELRNVPQSARLVAYAHTAACALRGGPRFDFAPGGPVRRADQLRVALRADGAGIRVGTAQDSRVAGPDARSVVVTRRDAPRIPVACVDLGIPE